MKKFRIKVCSPNTFWWITKPAANEELAKTLALGPYAGRLGLYIGEIVEITKEAA